MSPSDGNTNATVEQLAGSVSGTSPPIDYSNLCDWSKGHTYIDLPAVGLFIGLFIGSFALTGIALVIYREKERKVTALLLCSMALSLAGLILMLVARLGW